MTRGRNHDSLDALKRRRASWTKEIGQSNEWSHLAPQFVRELGEEIAALEALASPESPQ